MPQFDFWHILFSTQNNMKDIHNISLILLCCISFACQTEKPNQKTIQKGKFINKTEASTSKMSYNTIMDIDYWSLSDSLIICKCNEADYCFYLFNKNDISLFSSYGIRGDGPDEFVAPHIIRKGNNLKILDNGKRNIRSFEIKDSVISTSKIFPLQTNDLYDLTTNYSDSLLCMASNNPNSLKLSLYNYYIGNTVDSILFHDPEKKSNSFIYNFFFDITNDKLVIAHTFLERISIYNIKEEGFTHQLTIDGNIPTEFGQNKIVYYTDVACNSNKIYCLTQRSQYAKNKYSTVEVLSWDGTLEKEITLDIFATRILIDNEKKRLILFSPSDEDNIYFLYI